MELSISMALFYLILFLAVYWIIKLLKKAIERFTPTYRKKKQLNQKKWQSIMDKIDNLYDVCLPLRGGSNDDRKQLRDLREKCGKLSQLGLNIEKIDIDYIYAETETIYLKWTSALKYQLDAMNRNRTFMIIENICVTIQRDLMQIKEML